MEVQQAHHTEAGHMGAGIAYAAAALGTGAWVYGVSRAWAWLGRVSDRHEAQRAG